MIVSFSESSEDGRFSDLLSPIRTSKRRAVRACFGTEFDSGFESPLLHVWHYRTCRSIDSHDSKSIQRCYMSQILCFKWFHADTLHRTAVTSVNILSANHGTHTHAEARTIICRDFLCRIIMIILQMMTEADWRPEYLNVPPLTMSRAPCTITTECFCHRFW